MQESSDMWLSWGLDENIFLKSVTGGVQRHRQGVLTGAWQHHGLHANGPRYDQPIFLIRHLELRQVTILYSE